jgi:hypothetical protein
MLKNSNQRACPFTDEIVSYIYGEIGGVVEREFETHLAYCTVCTDEFAAVANSRFSVFEWKKDAFDPLPTPEIVVPYPRTNEEVTAGFFAAVRAWAASLRMPVSIAAALALFIGVGFMMFSYVGNREQQFTSNLVVPAVQPDAPKGIVDPTFDPQPRTAEFKPVGPTAFKPIPASTVRQKRVVKRSSPDVNRQENAFQQNRTPQVQKPPVLTPYQETDDNSLRLADLFDEVGG